MGLPTRPHSPLATAFRQERESSLPIILWQRRLADVRTSR